MDRDPARRGIHRLAAVGLAVEPLPADLDGRGHRHPLFDLARRQLEALRDPARFGELAVGVSGGRAPAEASGGAVGLGQPEEVAEDAALDVGEVPFTCVMGMYSGNLVVVDEPAATSG